MLSEIKMIDLPEVLTAKDISAYLKISRRRVYELFILHPEHGGIPNITIGASKRVRRDTFVQWLERQEANNESKAI